MEKHNSCVNSLAIIQYVKEKAPERVNELFSDLGPEMLGINNPQAFLSDPNNWISSGLLIKLYNRAKKIIGNQSVAYEIGFNSVTGNHLGYIQKIVMFALGSVARILKHIQKVNDHFNHTKEVTLHNLSKNSAVVRLSWDKTIPLSKDFCLMNKGVYEAVPVIFGLPPMQLEETCCFFKGDAYCEYRLHWKTKTFFQNLWHKFIAPWKVAWVSTQEVEKDKRILKEKYNQVHQLNISLQDKIEQLLSLQEVSNAVLSTLKLRDVLDLSLKNLLTTTQLSRAGIFLGDKENKNLTFIHAVGIDEEFLLSHKGYQIPIDNFNNVVARAAQSKKPIFIKDTSKENLNWENPLLKYFNPEAFILIPLTIRGQIIGIIAGDRQDDPNFIKEIDQEFLISFSNQVAIAIENSNLYTQVKSSEKKYREIVENVHEGIWLLDKEGKLAFTNPHLEKILGRSNLIGKSIIDFIAEESKGIFEQIYNKNVTGEIIKEEIYLKGTEDRIFPVFLNSVPVFNEDKFDGSLALISDLTEKSQMERQLRHAQKLEAIGTLAGGIAHDFNNILSAILGYSELALDDIPGSNSAQNNLDQVIQGCHRAKDLVQQILTFTRDNGSAFTFVKLQSVIEETLKLMRASIPNSIQIQSNLESNPAIIMADPTQIHQVLVNLFTNAAHAMEKEGGVLKIDLKQIELTETNSVNNQELDAGKYSQLIVSDTGHGFDKNIAERIFEPYFTTKEGDTGTGLGLSVVHGIIKNHKGSIDVQSKPDLGTTFTVLLPIIAEEMPQQDKIPETSPFGHEHVLFVDDEKAIVKLAKKSFSKLGFSITACSDSIEAFNTFQKNPTKFDLVIADQTMPKMQGHTLAKKIFEINPDMPIILCSGFSATISKTEARKIGVKRFITKPITGVALAKVVREVLDAKP